MSDLWKAFESLPTDKDGWHYLTNFVQMEVEGGGVNALDLKIYLSRLQRFMDAVKPLVDTAARDYAETFGLKSFDYKGAKVEMKEAGISYDYSGCNHPKYVELKQAVEPMLEEIKGLEKTLQTLKGKMTLVDEDSGETFEVMPPIRKSKSIVQITLEK